MCSGAPRSSTLVADLRGEPAGVELGEFLDRRELRVSDIYKHKERGGWTGLLRETGREVQPATDVDFESRALKAFGRLTHIDDPERVQFYHGVLAADAPPRIARFEVREARLLTMLAWGLGSGAAHESLDEFFAALWRERAVRDELGDLLGVLDARSHTAAAASPLAPEIPLTLHARYSRQEAVAALGFGEGVKPKVTQGGILWVPQANADVFFIDLHKSERDYSPTTMYRDYAINRQLFHWESQSRQHPGQPTVQRYINHRANGSDVLLFVRERRSFELGTQSFMFLGPVDYVDHRGEKPVQFTWRMPAPMPEEMFEVARSVAAA